MSQTDAKATQQNEAQFTIQRLYLKDCSFETPSGAEVFRAEWKPQAKLDLQINHTELSDGVYEVVVGVTATTSLAERTAFLVEVKYAGVFTIQGFPQQQLDAMVNVVCPSVVFPYLREVMSDLVARGTFPQFILDPINFDALYQNKLAQQQQEGAPTTVN